jgi:type I restriction enzyme, S subunit
VSTWRRVPLKRMARVTYGLGQPPPPAQDGTPILRATNIQRGQILSEGLIYAELEDINLERAPLLRAGEILVVRSGAYTGDSALVTEEWEGAAPGYDLRLTPHAGAEPRFLAYQLLATHVLHQIDLARSRAAQPHLNAEELGEIEVHMPVLKEQRTIVDFLDRETARIDDLVRRKQDLHGKLKSRRRALVDDILGRSARRVVRVKNTVRSITSGPRGWSEHFSDTGPVFLRITNVSADSIDLLVHDIVKVRPPEGLEAERTRADEGDVVVSITAEIGAVGVVTEGLTGCHISQHLALLRTDQGVIEPDWLALSLFSSDAQAQLDSARYGGTKTQLSLEDVAEIRLPLPTRDRQRALVADWRAKDATTTATMRKLEDQLRLLSEHRQALVTAAVTGQT